MSGRAGTLAAAAAATVTGAAHGHLVSTGFGPFYDGITHPFTAHEDMLAVAAIAVLAGLRGPRCGRWILAVLPAAWLLGAAAGPSLGALPVAYAMPVLLAAAGGLAAADARIAPGWVVGLAALLGLLHGSANGTDLAPSGPWIVPVAGIICAVFCMASLIAGQVATLEGGWPRVAARVAGSWLSAIGLFMLGWALRPDGSPGLAGGGG